MQIDAVLYLCSWIYEIMYIAGHYWLKGLMWIYLDDQSCARELLIDVHVHVEFHRKGSYVWDRNMSGEE